MHVYTFISQYLLRDFVERCFVERSYQSLNEGKQTLCRDSQHSQEIVQTASLTLEVTIIVLHTVFITDRQLG